MRREAVATQLKATLGEAVVASLAATLSALVLEVPVWAMFVGWISYFSRGVNLRQGVVNLACVLVGIGMGIAAGAAMHALTPLLGPFTLTAVVFAVAMVALSLRHMPVFNNLVGVFLGLVAYFASHQPPSWGVFAELGLAAAVGAGAACIASALHQHAHRAALGQALP